MSYTKQQIKATVSFIIRDAFSGQSLKNKHAIEKGLTKNINILVRTKPNESKFVIDPNRPALFMNFFTWLAESKIPFPVNCHYVLKVNGQSVADHGGDLTLIFKPKKVSGKKYKDLYDNIIEGLKSFHLGEEAFNNSHQDDEDSQYDDNDEAQYDDNDEAQYDDNDEAQYDENNQSQEDSQYDASQDHKSDSEIEAVDVDFADDYAQMKARQERSFHNSSRTKSNQSLYHAANASLRKDQKEADLKKCELEMRQMAQKQALAKQIKEFSPQSQDKKEAQEIVLQQRQKDCRKVVQDATNNSFGLEPTYSRTVLTGYVHSRMSRYAQRKQEPKSCPWDRRNSRLK